MYMMAEVSQYVAVASFVEAWIEIFSTVVTFLCPSSPPLWRRGLKCISNSNQGTVNTSPPLWRRGLKYGNRFPVQQLQQSPPLWRRGLKFFNFLRNGISECRLLCGGVD